MPIPPVINSNSIIYSARDNFDDSLRNETIFTLLSSQSTTPISVIKNQSQSIKLQQTFPCQEIITTNN